jgi:hypothetical protein
MDLSEEQLNQIYTNAGIFLSPEEIAVLLDLDVHQFISEIKSKKGLIYIHYMKGKTLTKKEIRENVLKMARHGSPQAEELAEKYMSEQKIAEKNGK